VASSLPYSHKLYTVYVLHGQESTTIEAGAASDE
jgi:hypothetical protein